MDIQSKNVSIFRTFEFNAKAAKPKEMQVNLILFDPVCEIESVQSKNEFKLSDLRGKRIGYVFNQHVSALAFWKTLEEEIERKLKPSAVHRLYKTNTWASAPKPKMEELIRQTDYVLVGVGA